MTTLLIKISHRCQVCRGKSLSCVPCGGQGWVDTSATPEELAKILAPHLHEAVSKAIADSMAENIGEAS